MKIVFIGPVSPPASGPGIKNRHLIEELDKKNDYSIKVIDTLNIANTIYKKVVPFLKSIFFAFKKNQWIISISEKGRYVFVPFGYLKERLNLGKCILLPAGGNFSQEIKALPAVVRKVFLHMLQALHKICPETHKLEQELIKLGLANLEVLPNPRKEAKYTRKSFDTKKVEIHFISSVTESKGVVDCIKAVQLLNEEGQRVNLNIYGRLDKNFQTEFRQILSNNDHSEYHGIIDNSKVIKVLATKADVLALPTYYYGEGLPGILVEASFAGVPVITTKFDGIEEYFKNERHALFVEEKDHIDLADKLRRLIANDALRIHISNNLIELSDEFKLATVAGNLSKLLSK